MELDYKKLILQIIAKKAQKEHIGYPPEGLDLPSIEAMLIEKVSANFSISLQAISQYLVELEREGKIYNCGFPTRPAYTLKYNKEC